MTSYGHPACTPEGGLPGPAGPGGIDGNAGPPGEIINLGAFFLYRTSDIVVAPGQPVPWETAVQYEAVISTPAPTSVTIVRAGVYEIIYRYWTATPLLYTLALAVNEVVVPTSLTTSSRSNLTGIFTLSLQVGDVLELVNAGVSNITISGTAGTSPTPPAKISLIGSLIIPTL